MWRWLVQVGCLRAGFYSNDLLDILARPSATTIVPELQQLELGQLIPMSARHRVGADCLKGPLLPSESVALVEQTGQHLGVVPHPGQYWRDAADDPYSRRL